jgi:hypothetical protein
VVRAATVSLPAPGRSFTPRDRVLGVEDRERSGLVSVMLVRNFSRADSTGEHELSQAALGV